MRICEICGGRADHAHHVFGGKNRKTSDYYNMIADLCVMCHTSGPRAVHRDRITDVWLKRRYQLKFEETHSREEFIRAFGRNYINE